MAIIRGAYGGGQIKGSIAGSTYQQGPFGQVIRNRTVPVNPNTPSQVAVRAAMGTLSNLWLTALIDAERDAWKAYADETPIPDKFGTSQVVSGRAMFFRTNVALASLGEDIVLTAPTLSGVARPPVFELTSTVADGLVIPADTWNELVPGETIRVSYGNPVPVTRNFYKSPFGSQIPITSATTGDVTLKPDVAVPQVYFVSARLYDLFGRVSNEFIYRSPVTTGP